MSASLTMSMASLAVSSAGRGVTVARAGRAATVGKGSAAGSAFFPAKASPKMTMKASLAGACRAPDNPNLAPRRANPAGRERRGPLARADRSRAPRRAPARATRRSPASRRSLLRRARLLRGKSDDATEPASEPGRQRSFRSRILSSPCADPPPAPALSPVSARSLTSSPSFPPSISQVSRCPARSSPARRRPRAAARWW